MAGGLGLVITSKWLFGVKNSSNLSDLLDVSSANLEAGGIVTVVNKAGAVAGTGVGSVVALAGRRRRDEHNIPRASSSSVSVSSVVAVAATVEATRGGGYAMLRGAALAVAVDGVACSDAECALCPINNGVDGSEFGIRALSMAVDNGDMYPFGPNGLYVYGGVVATTADVGMGGGPCACDASIGVDASIGELRKDDAKDDVAEVGMEDEVDLTSDVLSLRENIPNRDDSKDLDCGAGAATAGVGESMETVTSGDDAVGKLVVSNEGILAFKGTAALLPRDRLCSKLLLDIPTVVVGGRLPTTGEAGSERHATYNSKCSHGQIQRHSESVTVTVHAPATLDDSHKMSIAHHGLVQLPQSNAHAYAHRKDTPHT
jgi:hypothetical protein